MGVDLEGTVPVPAGEVREDDPVPGELVEEGDGVVAVVGRVHGQVLDVEEERAVGLPGHGPEEPRLSQPRSRVPQQVGDVLEDQGPTEDPLHLADPPRDPLRLRLGEGNGQELPHLAGPGPAEGEVLGVDLDPRRVQEPGHPVEVRGIGTLLGGDREADPVGHHGQAPEDRTQAPGRGPGSVVQVIVDHELHEVDPVGPVEDPVPQGRPQPEAGAARDPRRQVAHRAHARSSRSSIRSMAASTTSSKSA